MEESRITCLTIKLGSIAIRATAVLGCSLISLDAIDSRAGETEPEPATATEQPGGYPAPPAATTGAAEAERTIILVCGFPMAEESGANPVSTLNRALIDESGERHTAEF